MAEGTWSSCPGTDEKEFLCLIQLLAGTELRLFQLLQVPLPRRLCVSILALAFLDYSLSRGWEFFLRQQFPAPCPPQKGYLHYRKQQIQGDADKKKL